MDPTRKLRALVIEDDPEMAGLVRNLLRKRFSIIAEIAPDRASARRMMSSQDYDLITLDYRLPDGAGLDLLDEITESLEHPPVIMVTGHGDEETAARSFRSRASGYVVKDARLPKMLSEAVEKALAEIALKKVERELLDDKAFIEDALNSLPDLFAVLDIDGNLFRWNHRVSEVTGYSDAELSSKNIIDLFRPEDKDLMIARMQKMKEGVWAVDEVVLVTRTGEQKDFELSGRVLRDHKGFPIGFCGTGRDVTERRSAEEELKEQRARLERLVEDSAAEVELAREALKSSEEQFRSILENSPDIIATFDEVNGRFSNRGMSKKNDTGPAAVQGARVVANLKWLALVIFIAAELAMSVTGIIYLALGDISLGVFLTAFLVSTVVILALIVAACFYARRVWLGFSTGQAELVEKTTESRERYQALFESSADGIVYTDAEGRIIECNQAFADMLRYSRAELYGMTYREITPTDWHHVDDDIMESQMKESGYSDEYMKEYLMRNGTRLPVSVRSWVDYEYSGGTAGAWAVARNMSERIQYENFMRDTLIRLEQANERLQELDRLKTDLVAMVSHELRAPLGTIESSLNAMRSLHPGGSPEKRDELMTLLGRGVRRLTGVVDDLMDITRIESGQLKLEPAPVNAFEVAERVVKSFKDLSMEKGIDVVLEHSAGRCPGTLDPHRIEQVLTNLVDNALKFSGKGPVVVRVERTCGNTVFSVEDSGPGIPGELHQKVFEKFFSLDVQSCEGKQGIGLGLAISRGIVEAHGGRIWVESHKGEGTTFVFEIPQET